MFAYLQGDKNIIKFEGDHNSSRPQFYYDSVSIFFYNVLHPPRPSPSYSTKIEKYYDLGDVKVGAGVEEVAYLMYIYSCIVSLNITWQLCAKFWSKLIVLAHACRGTFILLLFKLWRVRPRAHLCYL